MNLTELREAIDNDLVVGTTCANCVFTKGQPKSKTSSKELNKFGGITPTEPRAVKRFEQADVITMPGEKIPSSKSKCGNPHVDHWVTERMCCNLWDHPGVIRHFEGRESEL